MRTVQLIVVRNLHVPYAKGQAYIHPIIFIQRYLTLIVHGFKAWAM